MRKHGFLALFIGVIMPVLLLFFQNCGGKNYALEEVDSSSESQSTESEQISENRTEPQIGREVIAPGEDGVPFIPPISDQEISVPESRAPNLSYKAFKIHDSLEGESEPSSFRSFQNYGSSDFFIGMGAVHSNTSNGEMDIFTLSKDYSKVEIINSHLAKNYISAPLSNQIIYLSQGRLYRIDMGTKKNSLLSHLDGVNYYAISPDQKKVLFLSRDRESSVNYNNRLNIVDIDGKNLVHLTKGMEGRTILRSNYDRYLGQSGANGLPQFLPDGSKIVFTFSSKLYTINLDGSQLTQINSETEKSSGGSNFGFTVSPDSSRIIFRSYKEDNSATIFSASPDGNEVVKIASYPESSFNYPYEDFVAKISPDGEKVIYRNLDEESLYQSNLDGSAKQKINGGQESVNKSDIKLTSDGGIIYAYFNSSTSPAIHEVIYKNLSTQKSIVIATGFSSVVEIFLSPDEEQVAIVARKEQNTQKYSIYATRTKENKEKLIREGVSHTGGLAGHSSSHRPVLFTPDSKNIIFRNGEDSSHIEMVNLSSLELTPLVGGKEEGSTSSSYGSFGAFNGSEVILASQKEGISALNLNSLEINSISSSWPKINAASVSSFFEEEENGVGDLVTTRASIHNPRYQSHITYKGKRSIINFDQDNQYLRTSPGFTYFYEYKSNGNGTVNFYLGESKNPEIPTKLFLASTNSSEDRLSHIEWAQDDQWVSYTRGSASKERLFVIKADGSSNQKVSDFVYHERAMFSPDSQKLIYRSRSSSIGSDWVLYSYDLGDKVNTPLSNPSENIQAFSSSYNQFVISPNSQWIAYPSADNDGVKLNIRSLDGNLKTDSKVFLPTNIILATQAVNYGSIRFSPDSKKVIFVAREKNDGNDRRLYSVNTDGTGLAQLSPNGGQLVIDSHPSAQYITVSPDSKMVFFMIRSEINNFQIAELYSVGIEGGQLTKLSSPDEREIYDYHFHSNSSQLVYAPFVNGKRKIIAVDVNGQNKKNLITLPIGDQISNPVLTSNGHFVFYGFYDKSFKRVYSVSITDGKVVDLMPHMPPNRNVYVRPTKKPGHVMIQGDVEKLGVPELYRIPVQ